jgi:hypothetical protein
MWIECGMSWIKLWLVVGCFVLAGEEGEIYELLPGGRANNYPQHGGRTVP